MLPIIRGPSIGQQQPERTTLFEKFYYGNLMLRRVLWILLGGPIVSLLYVVGGVVLCITIVGLPFGLQAFGMAWFVLNPVGKQAVPSLYISANRSNRMAQKMYGNFTLPMIFVLNLLWQILLIGWLLFFVHLILAFINLITIVGIGNAYQHLMLAVVGISPFGRQIAHDPSFPIAPAPHLASSHSNRGRTTGTIITPGAAPPGYPRQQPMEQNAMYTQQQQQPPLQPFGRGQESSRDNAEQPRFPGDRKSVV